tara:strand:- start:783 stop:1235 length:453 start_codon:yes stop_codon:yes gene_type:complete
MSEDVKKEEPKKKGIFSKLKEATDDKEEQLAILSTFVRLGILIWSGGILTLAYVDLPPALQIPKQDLDPTFIASVFTGVLATFGVQTANKKNNGTAAVPSPPAAGAGGITKADIERLIAAAKETAPTQTIRVEQGPIKIVTDDSKENYKL